MPKPVNVPPDFFHCPQLSKRERTYLIQKARDSAKTLVESTRSGTHGPIRWFEAGFHKGVRMYKGEARDTGAAASSGEQVNYACGATTVQASIEEVAEFFDFSTTAKAKAFAATQDDMMDHVVLYTLAEPREDNHFLHQITVKWFVMNMPSVLIKDRDFLTLECQDAFTDPSGRRGWVRSYHSVKLACCPDLQKEMGFVRGSFYHTGYVFIESDKPGVLDCVFSCQVNLKGNLFLPSSLHFIAMKRRIGAVADLNKLLHERRLGKQPFLSDLELVPKSHRVRCDVCLVKFGVLTRKTRCRKCGEVVCHPCTQLWEISNPRFGLMKVRVCLKCCAVSSPSTTSGIQERLEAISLSSERQSLVLTNLESQGHQQATSRRPSRAGATPRARGGETMLGVPFSRRELSDGGESYLTLHDEDPDYDYEYGEVVPSPPPSTRSQLSPARGVPVFLEERGPRMVPGSYLQRSYTREPVRDKLTITQFSHDTTSSASDYGGDDDCAMLSARALDQHGSFHTKPAYPRSFSYTGPVKTRAEPNGSYYDRVDGVTAAEDSVNGKRPRVASSGTIRSNGSACPPLAPPQETAFGLSFSSDQEHQIPEGDASDGRSDFDLKELYSPVSRAIADDFSTLLKPEAPRDTMESFCFSIGSCSTEPRPSVTGQSPAATTAKTPEMISTSQETTQETAVSLVELYQKILELTKQQHALDTTPEADAGEKGAVAHKLRSLYQQLNGITNQKAKP